MSLSQWMSNFRDLHERARRRQLSPREEAVYKAGRDELARALLAAQKLTLRQGQVARQALRVTRALQVDLDLVTSRLRAVTLDVSTGGFAALLEKAPPLGEEVGYSIRIPASDPVAGRARVADLKPQTGNVRVAFQFVNQSPEDRERLEMFVFDTVLAAISG
ncbi:MAG TPA: PilZ domain-containing protein [Anaeromyxobacteraceae bacterium]|nr:PilZ domain-containing protein [Anaeromyxobacteraceae bacterium]